MRYAVLIAGAALLADGMIMALGSNYSLGIILTVLLGALVLVYGILFEKINRARGPVKWLRNAAFVGLGCFVVLAGFLACYGNIDSDDKSVDALIVLGAGVHGDVPSLHLARRLDRAAEYHFENPETLIVVSGGQGFQENITEALAMKRYLLAKGVAEDRIVMEDQAASTRENFRFSKEILDGLLGEGYTSAYITNDFHVYRAGLVARSEGFESIVHYHARTEWYAWPQNYLRESLAVVKTWVLG